MQSKYSRVHNREIFWFLWNVTSNILISIGLWIFSDLANIFFTFCFFCYIMCLFTHTHLFVCASIYTAAHTLLCLYQWKWEGDSDVFYHSPPYFSIKTQWTWNTVMKVNRISEKSQHSLCFCLPSTGLTDTGCQLFVVVVVCRSWGSELTLKCLYKWYTTDTSPQSLRNERITWHNHVDKDSVTFGWFQSLWLI